MTFKQFLIKNEAYNRFMYNYKRDKHRVGNMPLCNLMKTTKYNKNYHRVHTHTFFWDDSPEGYDYWYDLIEEKWKQYM